MGMDGGLALFAAFFDIYIYIYRQSSLVMSYVMMFVPFCFVISQMQRCIN